MQVNSIVTVSYPYNKDTFTPRKIPNRINYDPVRVSYTSDVFIKKNASNISFQSASSPFLHYATKYLKNMCYERSIKASKRPYLEIAADLKSAIHPIEIQVNKKEFINAFDINPKNANKYVIFLHGFSQNITENQPLYRELLNTDYGILAIDYRSYGHNKPSKHTGETHIMNDINSAVKYLKNKGINNIGLLGHSFGGYMSAKTSNLNNFNFQILVSPVLSMDFWRENVLRNPGKYKMEERLLKFIPSIKEAYKQIFNIEKHIEKNTTPTYVIHSKTDGYINYKTINEFVKNIFNLKGFNMLPRGGHRMDDSKITAICELLETL